MALNRLDRGTGTFTHIPENNQTIQGVLVVILLALFSKIDNLICGLEHPMG